MNIPLKRPPIFPPDLCSAETLAHRLDCSVSTVHNYVRRGLLPKPVKIGELVRWPWATVELHLERGGCGEGTSDDSDPYLASIQNGAPTQSHD